MPQLAQELGQRLPLDVLHRVIVDAALAADGIDRDDVGVVQLRRSLGLDVEASQLPGIDRRGQGQDLQGHPAPQRLLFGLVDDPHAAASDLADDPVIAEEGPGPGDGRVVAEFGHPPRQLHHLQAAAQLRGDRRVLGQQPVGVGGPAGLQVGEVVVEDPGHFGVLGGRGVRTVADGVPVAAHGGSRNV